MRSLLSRGVRSVFGALWTTRYPDRDAVDPDSPPPSRLSDPRVRTALYSTMLFFVGVLAWLPVSGLDALGVPGPRVPWWVLAPSFAVSEIFVLHVQVRREARTISLSDLPFVLGLFFAAPSTVLTARLVSGLAIYIFWRRQSVLKVAFNTGALLVEAGMALILFRLLVGPPGLGLRPKLAALATMAVVGAITAMLVIGVIALNEGLGRLRELPVAARSGAVIALAVTATALLAVEALAFDRQSVILLVSMVAVLLLAYRAYAALSQRHLSLERLYQFTQVVSSSPEIDEVLRTLLHQAKELLRAEQAEVMFLSASASEHGEVGVRVSLDRNHELRRGAVMAGDSDATVLGQLLASAQPLLVRRGNRPAPGREWAADRGFREAVAAPLRGDAGVIGMIVVADRLGEVMTFNADDIHLLQTVANHASVALENGRLVEQLRHEALHDGLTGLPNRVQLQRRLRSRLERGFGTAARPADGFAVMLIDLDGFKEVNDSLGHQQGDELLCTVSARLSAAVRGDDLVARLGGDEFALMVGGIDGEASALEAANRILRVFDNPISLDGTEVQVRGSLGVSLAPLHSSDAAALLKQADMAMYAAKEGGNGAVLYEPSIDTGSPQRLALIGELRTALQSPDQIVVYLQPQALADSGQIVAAEALVRWQHPTRGLMAPDSFISLAERCGLIRPLTSVVLRDAVDIATGWYNAGRPLSISVNLSPRCLLDPTFTQEVLDTLSRTGLPSELLTLEITESCVMSDPDRTIGTLQGLAALGVRLSVDDFGTGYSSLSYLQRLPVHEVKIDKSFVMEMAGMADNDAIVRSIVDLGSNLGLDVVAEGVESAAAWGRLRDMGCRAVQGYHLARPMPAGDLPQWLENYRPLSLARSGHAA
ncbi:MAG: EAL domain-containing protein [Actinomycetota bacterium]|nr:EAL domain-containing protein [Actinomycetota bacterium]